MIPAAAIRAAITDVLEGSIGSVRTMLDGQMLSGVFEGQADGARKAKTLHSAEHRFDVRIGRGRQHEASPVGAIGSYSLKVYDIFVDVTTKTATQIQEDARDEVLATVVADVEQAAEALSFPANVEQSAALEATGIVSGMLLGPGGDGEPECGEPQQDWDKQEIRTRISASAIIRVRRNTVVDSTPLDIFGGFVSAWYRADNAVVSGASLSTWTDLSGADHPLTDASLDRLQLGLLTINNQPTLTAPSGGFSSAVGGMVLREGQAPNVFIFGQYQGDGSETNDLVAEALDDDGDVVFSCFKQASFDTIAFRVGGTTISTGDAIGAYPTLYQMLHDGENAYVRVNNGTVVTAAAGLLDSEDVASFGLPAVQVGGAQFSYAEVLILSGYPTATQVAEYRAYLAARYGLALT